MEACKSSVAAKKLLNTIKHTPPSVSANGKRIVFPKISDKNYEVSLYGSSNKAVVALDGTVYSPLNDTRVSVMYQVVNKQNASDYAIDNFTEISFIVYGKESDLSGENGKPAVIPSLREWKGGSGCFCLTGKTRIVYTDVSLCAAAKKVSFYFSEMLKKNIGVENGKYNENDIVLSLSRQKELGKEGYFIKIDKNNVMVSAPCPKGIMYAGITLTQIFFLNAASTIPCGNIRDYPQYEVRSAMLDVGRKYIPIDYLREITRYVAYFKLNELHLHINDGGGDAADSFRVQSKLFPEINSDMRPDEIYTQEQYKAFQREAESFGVQIMTEIDTPAHAGFASFHDKSLMLNWSHLDITDDVKLQKTLSFIKALYDEFLDGEDPVFRGKRFHIGTDEYEGKEYSEQVRKYINEMIEYVNFKGITPQFWATLGTPGFEGKTPVSNKAVANNWCKLAANFTEMVDSGYRFVNSDVNSNLYVVPTFPQYGNIMCIDAKNQYDNWEVNRLGESWLPEANPLLLGSSVCFWHDKKGGLSYNDVFDSLKSAFMIMSEKNWYGKKGENMSGSEFAERIKVFGNYAPGANPARFIQSNGDGVIASFDFSKSLDDKSGMGHNLKPHGDEMITDKIIAGALQFRKDSYISTDISEVGNPYAVSFDIYIDKSIPENALLFSNKNTRVYLNYDGTGKIGYEREDYRYIFDYVLDTERKLNICITSSLNEDTHIKAGLSVDGDFVAYGEYYKMTYNFTSSSLVFPLEKVGGEFIGKMFNLIVYSKTIK